MSQPTSECAGLRIGEAALRAGVSERTLRYYEELGLLCPAAHRPGGNRRYGEAEIERVRRIRHLQELVGLNLDEIRSVLASEDRIEALRAQWHSSEDRQVRAAVLRDAIAATEPLVTQVTDRRQQLDAFLDELKGRLERYRTLLGELETTQ